jgi:hypothetical protein
MLEILSTQLANNFWQHNHDDVYTYVFTLQELIIYQ